MGGCSSNSRANRPRPMGAHILGMWYRSAHTHILGTPSVSERFPFQDGFGPTSAMQAQFIYFTNSHVRMDARLFVVVRACGESPVHSHCRRARHWVTTRSSSARPQSTDLHATTRKTHKQKVCARRAWLVRCPGATRASLRRRQGVDRAPLGRRSGRIR